MLWVRLGFGRVVVGRVFGERDLEVDLQTPAADADLLGDEPQQPAATFGVEVVERGGDLLGEASEPAAQPVLGRELGAAASVLLLGELVSAGRDGCCATGELVEFEQPGGGQCPAAS
jgi:hypothetical protein